jgi:DNA-binding PadR family transcriptional regulator
MSRLRRTNPLALAVLTCLWEKPMHPYEVAQTLRSRHKHESIRLNYGSLYGVVASLERRTLIRATETEREGRRPERTLYEITDAGTTEMIDWLSELVAVPAKEYLQFEAGLSLMGALPPEDVRALLEQRVQGLEVAIAQSRAVHELAKSMGLPRLFLLEDEYKQRLLETERDWVQALLKELEHGAIEGQDFWEEFHRDRTTDRTA